MEQKCEIVGAATEKHAAMIATMARVTGATRIVYADLGNGEDYTVTTPIGTMKLSVRWNRFDGGFLAVEESQ